MDKSVKQLRRNNSPTIEFFESCCKEYDDADRNINHCMARPTMHRVFRDWCKINVPSAYIPTAKEFYRDILQYKKMTEGNLIKLHHGYEYYKFTLTLDAKRDFNIYDNVNIDTT